MNMIDHQKRRLLGLLFFFQCFLLNISQAQVDQSGWHQIVQNDFIAAKATFLKTLEKNPKDQDALAGILFVAETVQDYKLYKTYSKQLIESEWDENLFALFGHLYEADPEDLLKQLKSEKLKAAYHFAQADSLFHRRKFKAYEKELRETIGDYNWTLIGPFTNVSGSGYSEATPVETGAFDMDAVFKNERDVPLKWERRKYRSPNGIVSFKNVVPYAFDGMYYANTFFTTPNDRTTQLRIARSTPMKIWLDDHLIFDGQDNIAYDWDIEIIELELKAGTHRLMVKCANYYDASNSNTISLNYNDAYDQGDGYYSNNYGRLDYSYQSNNYQSNSRSVGEFGIRITDVNGKVHKDIDSSFEGEYTSQSYQVDKKEKELIKHFKDAIEKNPQDLKNYFYLTKAYFLYELTDEGEGWFFDRYAEHKEETFFRYLMAKFYAANGKGEKAESLISGLDDSKTPFFALMETELTKIDQEKNESDYLTALNKLLDVSPTNWGIISNYLDFYDRKGNTDEKKKFIENFLERYPEKDYQKRLKPYLEDDSYKPSSYKALTDKEKEKKAKEAMKRIKKRFNTSDYWTLISHYKQKEKDEQVIKLYDELIEIYPYNTYWISEKAKFLFEKDKLDSALSELVKALSINPYKSQTYETIGDIYIEKGAKEKSYEYYEKALELKQISGSNNYGNSALENKMEKIREQKSMKKYFESISFEEALKDESWKNKYSDEESVILLYTIESALDEKNMIDYNQKMLIHIQNDAGAKYWTEANFGFLGNINSVKVLKKDGQEISPNRNYGYVVFKNLEAGDMIQIEGNSKASMTGELHNEFYHIAAISHEVPVHKAKIEFIHPKETPVYYNCYRLDCEPAVKEKDAYKILTWDFDDIPKMERETAVLDNLDSYAWIMFSTQEDWSKVVQWYLRKTYRRLETNYEIENTLLGIINEGMTDEEIVEAIYNYVTKEITYSFVSFLNSNYIPKKPSATISDQIGDCKDVASLMISMLRNYGIESYYVLVRSSNFTNSKPLPSTLAFNHVIVGYKLEDRVMRYLDLTTDYYPNYVIPEFDNNSWALVIRDGETDVFRLPNDMLNPNKTSINIDIKAKIKSDRSLTLEAATVGKGILGGKLREELNRVTAEDDRRKFLLNYFGESSFDNLLINDFTFKNLEDITSPLEMNIEMKAYNYIERVSNFYIVQVPLLNAITTRPALFNEKRYNNLDLNTLFETAPSYQNISLVIPSTFQLMELPKDIKMDNEFGTYEMTFEQTKNGIKIKRSLVLKTRLVEYQNYGAFKKFYMKLLDADRLKIALTKK